METKMPPDSMAQCTITHMDNDQTQNLLDDLCSLHCTNLYVRCQELGAKISDMYFHVVEIAKCQMLRILSSAGEQI